MCLQHDMGHACIKKILYLQFTLTRASWVLPTKPGNLSVHSPGVLCYLWDRYSTYLCSTMPEKAP